MSTRSTSFLLRGLILLALLAAPLRADPAGLQGSERFRGPCGWLNTRLSEWSVPRRYNDHRTRDAFSGLLLLRIGQRSGFEELARISHADLYLDRMTRGCRGTTCAASRQQAYLRQARHGAPILRSVVIDDHIFSLSGYGLKVNRLAKTSLTVASVGF